MRAVLWAALLAVPLPALADASISARAVVDPTKLGPGDMGVLAVEIDVPDGWHLWALDPGEGPQALALQLPEKGPIVAAGPWHGPTPIRVFDRGFQRELAQYKGGQTLTFERAFKVADKTSPGAAEIALSLRGQICTEEQCLPQRLSVPLKLELVAAPMGLTKAEVKGEPLSERETSAAVSPKERAPSLGAALGQTGARPEGGLWSFILLAFLAGLGALATPCVFPAIPLTVSFFSKFAEESASRGARLAAFYAVSMVACFTTAGVLISVLVGATGVQQFAAHPLFNLSLGAILVIFSLNLLGMFEIRVPSALLNLTNNLEFRYGPSAKRERGRLSDYVAVGVAAMTSTTVFFTCTVAFVGVVVVAAAQGEWFWPTVGMLAFSSAFVLPFFLLALFPQAARRLRGRSGSWLTVTRVTLGFIELAAALKFFSNADLVWKTGLLSREAALAIWVPLFLLAGLFLLGKLRFGEDMAAEEGVVISVPRMLGGAGMLSFSLYLALGLFTARPMGWVDGWLPPGAHSAKLSWLPDLSLARAEAKRSDRLVFANYTGFTCTNCRYMESTVFSEESIEKLLSTMVLAELYTDGMDPENGQNRDDQIQRFGTAALPFYSVERPDGTVIATFPSSTNHPEEFRRFLADAIEASKKPTAAKQSAPLVLATTALESGSPSPALAPGKWTLINFWASWCAPCRQELEGFMSEVGKTLEARGGRFATVTIDDDADRPKAKEFLTRIGVPLDSQLAIASAYDASTLDTRLGFTGDVPFTVLIDPQGAVAWSAHERLERSALESVLAARLGYAALR